MSLSRPILSPFGLKIMLERGFLKFWIFLLFFSEFWSPGWVRMEFGTKFFFSFSANLIPFWLKVTLERGFLIFWFFFYFSQNFLARVECERNSGLNFFSLFLYLSHPVWAKNNARNRFLKFFQFFCYFFRIFFRGSSMNGIRD